jgi:hypothetical protein
MKSPHRFLETADLFVQALDFIPDRFHGRDFIGRVLLLFLQPGDFLGRAVALGLELVGFLNRLAPFPVQPEQRVQID